jgi:hypothetical protein
LEGDRADVCRRGQIDLKSFEADKVSGTRKMPVDGVEGIGLPHLQLVDGGGGQEICAHQPGLLGIPGIGLGLGPALGGGLLGVEGWDEGKQGQRGKKAERL